MQEEKGAELWRDVRLGLGVFLHNSEVAYFDSWSQNIRKHVKERDLSP